MSKVKTKHFEFSKEDNFYHTKAKMRHSLRRSEENHIKKVRMENSKNRHYSYKYYVIDSKPIKESYKKLIPAQIERYTYPENRQISYTDVNGNLKYYTYTAFVNVERFIPEHIVTYSKYIGEEKIKPYLQRWSNSGKLKKFIKKQASKRTRKFSDILNGNDYKKLYDVAWELD